MDRDFILKSAGAFWAGYGACTAIITGGRLYINLTNRSMKVSDLLGTVAKATTRRKVAVFGLISYIAFRALDALLMKTQLKEKKVIRGVVCAAAAGACGVFASSVVTKSLGFDIIKMGVIASLICALLSPEKK